MPKFIAANWKMNLTRAEAIALAQALNPTKTGQVLVCPPFVHLEVVGPIVREKGILLGGQNCAHKPMGALTGEIAATQLVDYGCTHVILGHSERRQHFAESGPLLVQKIERAFEAGLHAVVCIGETLGQYERGETSRVLGEQLAELQAVLGQGAFTIAYEPVWAIGTGKVPQMPEIEAAHAAIRQHLAGGYRILYGGSVTPANAAEIFAVSGVDGALIGGASLKADGFNEMVGG